MLDRLDRFVSALRGVGVEDESGRFSNRLMSIPFFWGVGPSISGFGVWGVFSSAWVSGIEACFEGLERFWDVVRLDGVLGMYCCSSRFRFGGLEVNFDFGSLCG